MLIFGTNRIKSGLGSSKPDKSHPKY